MWKRLAPLVLIALPAAYLLITPAGTQSRIAEIARPPPGTSAALAPTEPRDPKGHSLLQQPQLPDAYCLTCHGDTSLSAGFSDGRTLSLYVDLRAVRDSAHDLLSCVTCHDTYEPPPPVRTEPFDFETYQAEATQMCSRCHKAAAEGYSGSAHSPPQVEDGKGATCIDCHSPDGSAHSIAQTSEPGLFLGAGRITEACGRCHEKAADSYNETSHGKVARLGDVDETATCTTCHSDHPVQPAENLVSSSAGTALATLCGDCHDGADASFARTWPGHTEGAPSASAANLVGRAGLLLAAVVVLFGLVHVSLDLFRRWAGPGARWK